jgi:hypothetical protein
MSDDWGNIVEHQWTEYHKGASTYRPGKDASRVPLEERVFIAWDGEGITVDPVKPQNYCLLAAHTPDGPRYIKGERLKTTEILRFLLEIEIEYPDAYHIGFGLGYDFNQFFSSLTKMQLTILHKTGLLYLNMRSLRVSWLKGKSLTVTQYKRVRKADGSFESKKTASITLYDVWSFFNTSFVKACEKFLGESDELERIRQGKKRRTVFSYQDIDEFIIPYCFLEIRFLVRLMETFRALLYGAGFKIRMWHGPGAIASFILRKNGVQQAMANTPDAVREAAQYAYAAGRFELPKAGYFPRVFSVDQNSAYPNAIAQLPNLANGEWRHVVGKPKRLARFGVYRVKSEHSFANALSRGLAPLFHRDQAGRISYPFANDGWYWSPEVSLIWGDSRYTILEGWEFDPADLNDRPFKWVQDMFNQRLDWQREGNSAEYALKIALNSLYGKMAQRVGWDKENQKPPKWHQLEWAGWVTSYTRACIYRMSIRLGVDSIVAIETDGIYTTTDPRSKGVVHDTGLGEWKISENDDTFYIQNGLAWLRKGDEWQTKYRGLDIESLSLSDVVSHLARVGTDLSWKDTLEGTSHRFIGIGAALVSKNWDERFCRWETIPRKIIVGGDGKRIHVEKRCRACNLGISPDKMAHDLVITITKPGMSKKHYLPWTEVEKPWWVDVADNRKELIALL